MLEVIGSKMYPSRAQLTKVKHTDDHTKAVMVFYVRENVTPEGKQVLELLADESDWSRAAGIVGCEDSLKRQILKSPEFTVEWAEAELAK